MSLNLTTLKKQAKYIDLENQVDYLRKLGLESPVLADLDVYLAQLEEGRKVTKIPKTIYESANDSGFDTLSLEPQKDTFDPFEDTSQKLVELYQEKENNNNKNQEPVVSNSPSPEPVSQSFSKARNLEDTLFTSNPTYVSPLVTYGALESRVKQDYLAWHIREGKTFTYQHRGPRMSKPPYGFNYGR